MPKCVVSEPELVIKEQYRAAKPGYDFIDIPMAFFLGGNWKMAWIMKDVEGHTLSYKSHKPGGEVVPSCGVHRPKSPESMQKQYQYY